MEENIFNLTVPSSCNNCRIDKFLQLKIDKLSRTRLQSLIHSGHVKLNSIVITNASKKIKDKDKIKVNFPPPKVTYIKANKIPLNILFDDKDLVVINKSPGVVVHPGAGNYEKTIVNGLLYKYKKNLSSVGGKLRPGIIHRIDKDTSGVIVVAKNDIAHIGLSKQFSDHTIKRVYEALVWGILKPQNGKIVEKISRSIKNRQLMAVRKDKGKISITNYKTLKIFRNHDIPKISLIECRLGTGRTHQIRVHMNFKGNSILGDKSYGKSKRKFRKINPDVEKRINKYNRQALHAKSLGFIHPILKKEMFFEAERPKDLDMLIKSLYKSSV